MLSLKSTLTLLVLSFLVVNSNFSADEGVKTPYIQLSSLKSQMYDPESRIVHLEQIDGSQNIDVTTPDKIIIKEAGTYFMVAAGQVGAEKLGDSGFVDLWFLRNGQPIPNSGVRQSVSDSKLTAVLISQTIMPLNAGDSISVAFFANKTTLGLVAFPPFQNEPGIPSIIFTMYKIGS